MSDQRPKEPVFNHERDCGLTNDAGTCECPQTSNLQLPEYTAEHLAANYLNRIDHTILSGPYTPAYLAKREIERLRQVNRGLDMTIERLRARPKKGDVCIHCGQHWREANGGADIVHTCLLRAADETSEPPNCSICHQMPGNHFTWCPKYGL